MKKLIALLFTGIILNSCSTDGDNLNNDNPEVKLDLTHYILRYPSGNVVQHNFNGTKSIDTDRNGVKTVGFEYNSDNKMSKYLKYSSDSSVDESYTFNYDDSGKMTSIDEFHKSDFFIPENFTRTLTYVGNSIKTTYPIDNTDNYKEEFIFNNEGLIQEYIRLDYDDAFDSKLTFEYDGNKNCTAIIVTGLTFSTNEQYTLRYEHIYDSSPNPLYSHFSENYIPNLFIYTRNLLFEYQIRQIIRTFGKNNMVQTIFPDNTPDSNKYTYQYEYNNAGYPKKVTTKNVGTGAITVENELYYKE